MFPYHQALEERTAPNLAPQATRLSEEELILSEEVEESLVPNNYWKELADNAFLSFLRINITNLSFQNFQILRYSAGLL
jgi:hypothetical protein